ncbi:MAG: copper transporter [Thermosediminibacteraceae bacterium]|nr:copper transporter [Thermosediminibacteraceae bacterium]
MYNFKYITILLIAVFIALGIGIAIGFTANSDKLLVKQQKEIIDQLETSYNRMKESSKMKEKQLKLLAERQKKDYEFLTQNFEMLLAGRLQGKRGSVIEIGNSNRLTEVVDCLKSAGAQVQFSTVINEDLINEDLNVFIEAFAGGDIKKLQYLEEKSFIEKSGVYDSSVDFIVIIRGTEKFNPASLVKKLGKLKPVAIVQTSNLPTLDIKNNDKLFYIDNIDTIMGKYRLVISLINNF